MAGGRQVERCRELLAAEGLDLLAVLVSDLLAGRQGEPVRRVVADEREGNGGA